MLYAASVISAVYTAPAGHFQYESSDRARSHSALSIRQLVLTTSCDWSRPTRIRFSIAVFEVWVWLYCNAACGKVSSRTNPRDSSPLSRRLDAQRNRILSARRRYRTAHRGACQVWHGRQIELDTPSVRVGQSVVVRWRSCPVAVRPHKALMRPRLPPSDADETDIPPGYFLLPFFVYRYATDESGYTNTTI